jgi:hypothetical protein
MSFIALLIPIFGCIVQEIDMDDMKIATHLSNVKTAGFTPSVNTSLAIFHEVNKKPIPEISNSAILHRIPGVASSEADSRNGQVQRELDLLTPTFSFVPGVEAYPVSCGHSLIYIIVVAFSLIFA